MAWSSGKLLHSWIKLGIIDDKWNTLNITILYWTSRFLYQLRLFKYTLHLKTNKFITELIKSTCQKKNSQRVGMKMSLKIFSAA
jgi:hypothetical protein